jgi:hypothetical protein
LDSFCESLVALRALVHIFLFKACLPYHGCDLAQHTTHYERLYQVDPINGQQDQIDPNGLINDQAEAGIAHKIEDLENISQAESESIRDWTLCLRRLVLEVKAMHGEHVVTSTAQKLKLLRIRPIPGQEDGFSAFIGDLRQILHLKTVEEIESELTAYEDGIQMQARLRPAATQLWHTYAGPKKHPFNSP